MKILDLLKKSDPAFKRNLALFLVAYFFVLFNYPMVRASSTTFFFEAFGAKSSPLAWLWGVLFLVIGVFISNKLQAKWTVQKVFLVVSTFTAALFLFSSLGFLAGHKYLSYVPFIWKEIYIVMQVHLLLAYANNFFQKDQFKILIGPVGAAGSIGGIIGGTLTSYVAKGVGTPMVMWMAVICVAAPAIFFYFTREVRNEVVKHPSPVASLSKDVRTYVALIAMIVALTQFIINIADFNFHMAFEASVPDSSSRTSYLGHVYTFTNLLTLLLQFLVLPFLLTRVSERNYHLFIPLSYLILGVGLMAATGGSAFVPVALFYIYLKASDYSLFSAGKEVLYQPLTGPQKYGAKYLTDMLVYRLSKALVAAVLIYVQSSMILNMMMIIFLILWVILIIKLFQLHRKRFS